MLKRIGGIIMPVTIKVSAVFVTMVAAFMRGILAKTTRGRKRIRLKQRLLNMPVPYAGEKFDHVLSVTTAGIDRYVKIFPPRGHFIFQTP
jgi:hypothetical protein